MPLTTMNNADGVFKIETKPGKSDKIHIFANGEYVSTVDAAYWYSSAASRCDILGEDELYALLSEIEKRRAYNKALRLLSVRDHGKKELFDKLRMLFSEEAAEEAVERLVESGYLDDEAYAKRLSDELFCRKKYGSARIMRELILKGISREDAVNAVEGLDIDDYKCIIELLYTKFSGSLSDEKDARRTFNSILRMGYGASDIKKAMREFLQ